MRIAFMGASGTGKATLAEYVAGELDIPLLQTGSRSTARAMGFENPYDVDRANLRAYESYLEEPFSEEEQEAAQGCAADCALRAWPGREGEPTVRSIFQLRLQQAKLRAETGAEAFVTDRSSLDDAAYAIMHCPQVFSSAFRDAALDHHNTYDIVFFCPLVAFYSHGEDASRVDDLNYHRAFEAALTGMRGYAESYSPRIETLVKGDLPWRKSAVLTILEASASKKEKARWF